MPKPFHGFLVHAEALRRPRREDDFGAEEPHQLAPLDREAVGHGDDQRIALGGADHRKADAGIPAGRLDHRLPRLQRAAALGFLDDADRQAILDRRRRVEVLRLHVQPDMVRRQSVDADTGRIANRIHDAVIQAAPSAGRPRFLCSHDVPLFSRLILSSTQIGSKSTEVHTTQFRPCAGGGRADGRSAGFRAAAFPHSVAPRISCINGRRRRKTIRVGC
jgi:hypothetical protein